MLYPMGSAVSDSTGGDTTVMNCEAKSTNGTELPKSWALNTV
jgi:hypothetical protein